MKYVIAQVLGRADSLGVPKNELTVNNLGSILNVVYLIAGAIAVLMIVIAGINFTTAGGDANKAAKAKNTILYSVIGIIIISSAFAITNFVIKGVK